MAYRPYTGPYQWGPEKSNFYIHINQANIGRANNGKEQDLVSYFGQHKQNVFAASQKYYKSLFLDSVSEDSRVLLDEILNNDDMFTELDKQMTSSLQKVVSSDKLHQLLRKQSNLYKSVNVGQALLNGGLEAIKAYNKLLDTFAECCFLIGEEGNELALALLDSKHALGTRFFGKTMGKNLKKALADFTKKNNGTTAEGQAIQNIAKQINALAKRLSTSFTDKKGRRLTAEGINGIVEKNIFSKGFAESLAGIINNTAESAVSAMESSLIGDKTAQVMLTDTQGNPIGFDPLSTKSAGKADVRFDKMIFNLSGTTSPYQGSLVINTGISVKSYRRGGFGNVETKSKGPTFSSGSGGTLKEALYTVFGSSNIEALYLAYNIFGHSSKRTKEVQALNDIILTRQIVRLFSSRSGSSDFSQYMLLNGEVVSVWEILMTTQNFVGFSASQENATQAVQLSIPDRNKIEGASGATRYDRVKAINDKINSAKIYAHLHINKLKNARKK